MKNAGFVLLALIVGAGLFWLGRATKKVAAKAPAVASSVAQSAPVAAETAKPAAAPQPSPQAPTLMSNGEWQQLRSARDSVLQSNPDLQAEYKRIMKKMDAQQAKLDAAMIKADPSVKPVVAKLVALRQQNTPHTASSSAAPVQPAPSIKLTQDDYQALRTARTKALQTDKDLIASAKTLADEMRALEQKVDAAMIKADPSVSPMIAKFEGAHRAPAPPQIPVSPPATK